MLELKLDLHYKHCIQKGLINEKIFKDIKQFILENYSTSRFLDPFIFAEKYNKTVEETLRIFLMLTDGNDALFDTKLYFQCNNIECKDILFLDDFNPSLDDFLICTNCDSHYTLDNLDGYTYVYFILSEKFINKDPISYSSSVFDIIRNSSQSAKYLPPSTDDELEFIDTPVTPIEGGVKSKILEQINTKPNGDYYSPSFAERQKRLSRRLSTK